MSKAFFIIYACIGLDAIGIGLIFPILPRLIASYTQTQHVVAAIGGMTALYALMQFICAPLLGAASDKLGRRPVLIFSLAGASINYFLMAYSKQFYLLLIGRAIAGISGANMSVAMAYITDMTAPEHRAKYFGWSNAVFGAGFILGPVLGGLLGDYDLHLPFVAAAILNLLNLLLALFALPESRTTQPMPLQLRQLNPVLPLIWLVKMKPLLPLILLFFMLSMTGEVYGTCWAMWGQDSFGWNGVWIGFSLACFGICQTLAQASLPGLAVKRLGERRTILLGFAGTGLALIVMATSSSGWPVFAIMPLFVMASVGVPALQALASRMVDEQLQGQFQGLLAAVISLASIIGPLIFSMLYYQLRLVWPGAIWLSVLLVYILATPLVLRLRF